MSLTQPDLTVVASRPMVGDDLASAIERATPGVGRSALARRVGIAAKTLKAILDRDPDRTFLKPTIDRFDHPLGWDEGTAWRLYRTQLASLGDFDADDITLEMRELARRLAAVEERPGWADEWVAAARLLTAEDRAMILQL